MRLRHQPELLALPAAAPAPRPAVDQRRRVVVEGRVHLQARLDLDLAQLRRGLAVDPPRRRGGGVAHLDVAVQVAQRVLPAAARRRLVRAAEEGGAEDAERGFAARVRARVVGRRRLAAAAAAAAAGRRAAQARQREEAGEDGAQRGQAGADDADVHLDDGPHGRRRVSEADVAGFDEGLELDQGVQADEGDDAAAFVQARLSALCGWLMRGVGHLQSADGKGEDESDPAGSADVERSEVGDWNQDDGEVRGDI